jgi:hypothetical protein
MAKRAVGPFYSLKITLQRVQPPVWRRIVISGNRTLGRLNAAVQAAMGWTHSHLHVFQAADGSTYSDATFGIDDADDQGRVKIKDVLPSVGSRLRFEYDFGDSWNHEVVVEGIQAEHAGRQPHCFDGARACPPEDVGGAYGYAEFCAAISDPKHARHAELRDWYAGLPYGYDDTAFDPDRVDFDGINKRIARAPRIQRCPF